MQRDTSPGKPPHAIEVCLEYPAHGPLARAVRLWAVHGDRWVRAHPCPGRLFRRSTIRRHLLRLALAAAPAHPRWSRAVQRVLLPVLTRHRAALRYRCWRFRPQAPLDHYHLVLWFPVSPRLRLLERFQVYFRTIGPGPGPWQGVPDACVHAWISGLHVVYVVAPTRVDPDHGVEDSWE